MASGQDERFTHVLSQFPITLRAERLRAGLTQAELAERSRLSVTMVQNLERPSYAGNPRLSTLLALAEALDLPPVELIPQASERADPAPVGRRRRSRAT